MSENNGLSRSFKIDRKKVDPNKRTVELAFSSETPVERWGENEVLSHNRGDYDFSRFAGGDHPLLLGHDEHNPDSQIGVIQSARVDSDKVGRAVVRFGNSAKANEIFQDVQDGIRQLVSVGYDRTSAIKSEKAKDGKVTTRYKWAPTHIAIVPVPADTKVGIGRNLVQTNTVYKHMEPINEKTEIIAISKMVAHDCEHIAGEIKDLTADALTMGMSLRDYRGKLMELRQANPRTKPLFSGGIESSRIGAPIGMSDKDQRQYSIRRLIRSAGENNGRAKNCFEADCSQQAETNMGIVAEGTLIPADVSLFPCNRGFQRGRRDMQAEIFAQGGAFVPTQMMTPPIEVLRNLEILSLCGTENYSGLQGNINIPRQDAAATAFSVPEIGALTQSSQVLGQIALSPKRIGATQTYSKQFVFQSTPDAESFLRDDLFKVMALKRDYLGLNGQGANSEPMGLLNTPGVQSITFGGPATFAAIVSMQTALGQMNADRGNLAYITTPGVQGKLKTAAKIPTGGTAIYPAFIWEDDTENFSGIVNGKKAFASNQVPGNQVILGNFSDLISASWNGFDVVVDYVTKAVNAEIVITINMWCDFALRHPQSFCISTDAGNQ